MKLFVASGKRSVRSPQERDLVPKPQSPWRPIVTWLIIAMALTTAAACAAWVLLGGTSQRLILHL